ncbi:MAG: hypothetical protein IJR86_00315 [Bacteroidaceae bacterium]|nr:hypothetical protein [Bacteroidaceae bacterium]
MSLPNAASPHNEHTARVRALSESEGEGKSEGNKEIVAYGKRYSTFPNIHYSFSTLHSSFFILHSRSARRSSFRGHPPHRG